MPNEFNGNDAPAPEKSKKRRSTTPKARKSTAIASDGAAATPAPVTKTSRKKSTKSAPQLAAPHVQASEAATKNLSTMPTFATGNLHGRISERAYEIYVERGGQHGFDQADWLKAEAEVLGRRTA